MLRWFRRCQRAFPWRDTRDPYAVWVSEVMLQQTQAATVVRYFIRFLQQFPTIHALAQADLQAVQCAWEGLGYYRRARHLHSAAQRMVAERNGEFPDNADELLSYSGFGRYTVGAVLSRAFEMRLPILETNSERVLCRVLGYDGDPKNSQGRALLWHWAEQILPSRNIGDFNQAMMELGAVLCTPDEPQCGECPIAMHCQARRHGRQSEIPLRVKPKAVRKIDEVAVAVRKGGKVLIAKRPNTGRWAGLWEFPHTPLQANETQENAVARCVEQLTGYTVKATNALTAFRHSVMDERIRLIGWEARYGRGAFRSDFYREMKWLRPADLGDYPQSSPQRRLSRLVAARR